jgi:DNA-binding winged helix-turn-helix (wHTH) protein
MKALSSSASCVRFGLFEFNIQMGELHRQGLKIKLGRQALRILGRLLEHPGELRTREEIRQRLWGTDTFVNFNQSLNKAIYQLREGLGDSASNPRYIETVPGQGYRFVDIPQQSSPAIQDRMEKLRSLAVLPFLTKPTNREMGLLGKRVVEAVIDNISRTQQIRVLAYSTVQQYRVKDINLHALGEELLVRVVAVGEMIRPNDELLLHVELIDAGDGTQLWGSQFKEAYANVLADPQKLAHTISNRLVPILAGYKRGRRRKRSKPAA